MKIISVECLVLDEEYPYVILHTDEGITGFGECFRCAPYVSKIAVETIFAPLVIGRSPFDSEEIWDDMLKAGGVAGPTGALLTAAAGVDIALWDLKGKALETPIYNLIGGKRRDKIKVYASSLAQDMPPDVEARRVAHFRDQGYSAYKMHSAVPGKLDDPGDLTIETVTAIRKEVGYDVDVLVDVNGAYSVHHAIEIGRQLQDLGVFHYEEPVHVRNLEGLATIADALDMPVASGENAFTRWDHLKLIREGRPDIVQPDVVKVGGITEFLKIEAVLSAHAATMTIHNTQPYGSTAAHAHLLAPSNNFPYAQEYNIETVGIRDNDSIIDTPYTVEDGFIRIPDGPGLGLDYNIDRMRQRSSDRPSKTTNVWDNMQ
ncbi:MAG: mandelate racemase/muconate lactonizing enzyme family protein [Chloroflexi bacterium]|nr:mandelate racemase/muconate lactonizing enzyme family protein [Chloroflexota bacterium]